MPRSTPEWADAARHHETPARTEATPTDPRRATELVALGLEPLVRLSDWPLILSCSIETVGRLKAAGKLPRPDLMIGRSPRWRPETARRWLDAQAAGRKGVRL